MFLKRKKVTIDKQDVDHTSTNLLLTKLSFLYLENEVSPLFALIVFSHTQISQYCLNILQQMHSSFKSNIFALTLTKLFHKQKQIDVLTCYFSAMCCNGSTMFLKTKQKNFYPNLGEFYSLFTLYLCSIIINYFLR